MKMMPMPMKMIPCRSDYPDSISISDWARELAFRLGRQNPAQHQFDDLEGRDLLHGGFREYRYGFAVMNLGLRALAREPSQHSLA
jgi:hypothetical protein